MHTLIMLAAAFVPLISSHNKMTGETRVVTNQEEMVVALNGKADRDEVPSPTGITATSAIEWMANGNAISVTVPTGGTLSAVVSGWIEGQTVLAVITLAAGATIAPDVEVVGYSSFPVGVPVICAATRVGSKVFLNVICAAN